MPSLLIASDDSRNPGVEMKDFYLIINPEQEAVQFQETSFLMNDNLSHMD